METISNLANAASKVVWGDGQTKEEPLSGVQGDTSKGEPFDAGNMDNEPTNGESNPAATRESSKMASDSTKAQNDTRDPENPTTKPDKAAAARNVDDSGDGPNPTNVDGPGPKPLDEVAKEHGGDAGNSEATAAAAAGDSAQKRDQSTGSGDDDGPQTESHGEGTGEKYVKSSGLKADGGDFDAANPGAGREADRLLEEKGIHVGGSNKGPPGEAASPSGKGASPERKEKRSLGEKIKAKLHKSTPS